MTDNIEEGYDFPSFAFSNQKELILNTAYMMTGDSADLRFILLILNSKLGRFMVKIYASQLQQRQFRLLHQYVKNFPLPIISAPQREQFILYAESILSSEVKNINFEFINKLIYNLYGFSDKEIELIEK